MLTTADYLAFERRVVRNRMDLLFLSGEIERVDGLDQSKGETKLCGKKSRTTGTQ